MASPAPKTTMFRILLTCTVLTKMLVTETALQANMCCDQIAANMTSRDPFPTRIPQWIASNHNPTYEMTHMSQDWNSLAHRCLPSHILGKVGQGSKGHPEADAVREGFRPC